MPDEFALGHILAGTHFSSAESEPSHDEPAKGGVISTSDLPAVVGDPTIQPAQTNIGMSVAEICDALVALGRDRRFCIKSQSRCDRSVEAYLAGLAGYDPGQDATKRKELFALAAKLRKGIEKAGTKGAKRLDPSIAKVAPLVLASAQSRAIWDNRRAESEAEMRRIAKRLPIWKGFAADIRGLGELGLAVVIAEAGDLGKYATPAKLWKRLGLAVIGDIRQQKRTDLEEAAAHGYSPRRRAEIWAFFSDAMLRAVWRAPKGDVPGYPIGPYGAEYARKKAEYLTRGEGWPPARCDAAARRYMTKCVIRDLWAAWRSANNKPEPGLSMPTAEFIELEARPAAP